MPSITIKFKDKTYVVDPKQRVGWEKTACMAIGAKHSLIAFSWNDEDKSLTADGAGVTPALKHLVNIPQGTYNTLLTCFREDVQVTE